MNDYLGMLEKSRLFESAEQLQDCLKTWRGLETTTDPDDTHSFADWLIQNNYLTTWQSDNIFAGKYKGFFLGKYKLLRSIGAGGMSSVYLAVHTILERQVAIKVLPKSRVTSDSSYLERFLLEAQAVAALDHPNIVRAYDVDTEGNSIYYLVMEFIDGPDLLTLVKKEGPLDIYRAAKFIRQAALGLQHAHNAGLIHRDMKPANLLVDKDDVIHVLDLGLARFTDEKRASLTLTYDENVLGTADYLAPEQARNSHNVDARADIYGLGCTLYYLLVGHVPFPDGTLAQRIAAHQKRMPTRIQDERPEVPDSLAEICWKMMAKDPNDRQQTAEEVADDLTCFLLENGQKVEGFTGTLASLQRKKEENQEKKSGAIQLEALQDLNSLANIANLANPSGGRKEDSSSVISFGLGNGSSSGHSSALKRDKGPSKAPAKGSLFAALDRMKKMVENHLKSSNDDKSSDKSSVLSQEKTKKNLELSRESENAHGKDSSKGKIPDFSFGAIGEIDANIPEIPALTPENLKAEAEAEVKVKAKSETSAKAESKSESKSESDTKPFSFEIPAGEKSEPILNLSFGEKSETKKTTASEETSKPSAKTEGNAAVSHHPEKKTDASTKASAAHSGSSALKKKVADDPMAFLAQKGASGQDSKTSSDGSTHDFVLNFGPSSSSGGSTVTSHGVLDSGVHKKNSSSKNAPGNSSPMKNPGSSVVVSGKSSVGKASAGKSGIGKSGSGKISPVKTNPGKSTAGKSKTMKKQQAPKKKKEQLVFLYVALVFFVLLLIMVILQFLS
ncbi:MAG: serine/threonine protein kinase [Thermoguttaceae bacterium]|nr:serine/threonine protein kinase [Thermoguttaceae bacterium]